MYILYQIFYIIFLLFYVLVFVFKRRRREGIAIRFGVYPPELKQRLGEGRNIWLHAVSVGEIMTAKIIADKIKRELPSYRLVVSTVTETGNALAKGIMPPDSEVIYLPVDIGFVVSRVVKMINPAVFIIMEAEIWPALLAALKRNGVGVILSNGRISQKSRCLYGLVKPFFKNVLTCIDKFLMRTEEDAERIISLGAKREKTIITGNLKFDGISDYIYEEAETLKWRNILGLENKKLIVAGSTHPGEEEILLGSYRKLKHKYQDLILLIAPRHIERSNSMAKLIKSYGFIPVKISGLTASGLAPAADAIYILDTIGELKFFYSLAWVVFVGGSLVRHGGQNMIEPAFFQKPVLFGPHTFNFKDVSSTLLKEKGAILIKDAASFTEAIKALYNDKEFAGRIAKNAKEIVKSGQGASTKTMQEIKSLL